MNQQKNTSWQNVAGWYTKAVGSSGHYYHQHVVIPNSLRLLNLQPDSSVIDLACGQGILGRQIPSNIDYLGIDTAPSLIEFAKTSDRSIKHHYQTGNIEQSLSSAKSDFSHATIILALQNLKRPDLAINNAAKHLKASGQLLLVINHPAFRVPRQSSWEIDPASKLQYRRLNRYLSPLEIPISVQPSKQAHSHVTWSFHLPIQDYFKFLKNAGFVITNLEEWVSDKVSEGKAAKAENFSRSEFPLFMAILATKIRPS